MRIRRKGDGENKQPPTTQETPSGFHYKVQDLLGKVIQGDCIEELRKIPDNSISSVCTDPPYGLVSIVKRFGKEGSAPAKFGKDGAFSRFSGSAPRPRKGEKNCAGSLCGGSCVEDTENANSNAGKEPISFRISVSSVPVQLRTVKLNDGSVGWEVEVNADGTPRSSKSLLVNKGYSEFAKMLNSTDFTLRKSPNSSVCVGVCTCLAQPFSTVRAILVRLSNDSFCKSNRTPCVVAGAGAECRAVLTLDCRRRTGELHPAESAGEFDTCAALVSTKLVGTRTGAGSFSTPLKSDGPRHVGLTTDGAGSFCIWIHKDLLKRIDDPIIGPTGFMSTKWDGTGIEHNPALWSEVLRVLKPGGYVLSFGGSRTFYKMATALDAAGFTSKDTVVWITGQGFPKSHNLGEGRGTSLKPSIELIAMFQKPLSEKTYATNVERWGTGGINIDLSRIESGGTHGSADSVGQGAGYGSQDDKPDRKYGKGLGGVVSAPHPEGRWPANLILDPEAAELLDEQSGERKNPRQPKIAVHTRRTVSSSVHESGMGVVGSMNTGVSDYGDTGGASRYFFVAKPSGWEKEQGLDGKCTHPTTKPIALVRYLIRMVTPPGGICLDPFLGSGTTLCAIETLKAEGHDFHGIGIEKEAEYVEIAKKRIAWYSKLENAKEWLRKVGRKRT